MQTIRVGGSPQAIAVGNGRVWVSVQTALFAPGIQAGVLRVASIGIDSLDPAIGYTFDILGDRVRDLRELAQLPGPSGAGGVAARSGSCGGHADALADGKSYTFTIRPGFRFSPPSNAPVTAQTFKFSIERALSPKIPDGQARSFAADIVGAQAYEAGKAKHISGITVRGNTLTVRLTDVVPGHPLTARAAALLPRPARHPGRADRCEHGALGGTVLRRLVQTRTGRGAEAQSQLPRVAAARVRRDRLRDEYRCGAEP